MTRNLEFQLVLKAYLSTFDGAALDGPAFNACAQGATECALIYAEAAKASPAETISAAAGLIQTWLIHAKGFESDPDGKTLSQDGKKKLCAGMTDGYPLTPDETDALIAGIITGGAASFDSAKTHKTDTLEQIYALPSPDSVRRKPAEPAHPDSPSCVRDSLLYMLGANPPDGLSMGSFLGAFLGLSLRLHNLGRDTGPADAAMRASLACFQGGRLDPGLAAAKKNLERAIAKCPDDLALSADIDPAALLAASQAPVSLIPLDAPAKHEIVDALARAATWALAFPEQGGEHTLRAIERLAAGFNRATCDAYAAAMASESRCAFFLAGSGLCAALKHLRNFDPAAPEHVRQQRAGAMDENCRKLLAKKPSAAFLLPGFAEAGILPDPLCAAHLAEAILERGGPIQNPGFLSHALEAWQRIAANNPSQEEALHVRKACELRKGDPDAEAIGEAAAAYLLAKGYGPDKPAIDTPLFSKMMGLRHRPSFPRRPRRHSPPEPSRPRARQPRRTNRRRRDRQAHEPRNPFQILRDPLFRTSPVAAAKSLYARRRPLRPKQNSSRLLRSLRQGTRQTHELR